MEFAQLVLVLQVSWLALGVGSVVTRWDVKGVSRARGLMQAVELWWSSEEEVVTSLAQAVEIVTEATLAVAVLVVGVESSSELQELLPDCQRVLIPPLFSVVFLQVLVLLVLARVLA